MNGKYIHFMRLLVAGAVLVLCGLAFYRAFYPVAIFDAQFMAAVQSALIGSTAALVIMIALILITLLLGRVYCSTLCPLGLYQELLMMLFMPFYKKRKNSAHVQKHWSAAYVIMVLLWGSLIGGTAIVMRYFEPYSVAGNALSGAAYGIGFAIVLAVLVFFKKRFFCTHLCPVGAVLGLISRFSLFKIRIDADKCKMCSLCAKGDFSSAAKLQMKLMPLIDALFCDVNPIPIKEALSLSGFDAGPLRLPLYPLSEEKHEKLCSVLKDFDIV